MSQFENQGIKGPRTPADPPQITLLFPAPTPAPWPLGNGLAFRSLGHVMEKVRHSKLHATNEPLGWWGELTPGPGVAVMLTGVEPGIICADTAEDLARMLNEHLKQPAYKPNLGSWRHAHGRAPADPDTPSRVLQEMNNAEANAGIAASEAAALEFAEQFGL